LQPTAHHLVERSYARCLRSEQFMPRLYEHLLSSDPAIPPYFENTEFPRQYKLLQHGLGLLVSYAKNPDQELLARIAARHSAKGIDVPPGLYEVFAESLLTTIGEHDPKFDDETEKAWRAA
jgi:hemoglobin-like flavoprotein